MDSALIGLAGVVGGLILGGVGKYFNQRRDAWLQARAAGLLVLADVLALQQANESDLVVTETQLGTKSWESQRQTLAGFRRGTYPSGLTAPEWLTLAAHFARLKKLNGLRDNDWWEEAKTELVEIERLLKLFERDPAVLSYVIRNSYKKRRKQRAH